MKVLCFGEILWDVYPDEKCLGGAPLNFGAHLAKHGEDVYMLSALGRDALGDEARKQVTAWGMKDNFVSALDTFETGKCLVTLDENAVPSYNLLEDVAYDHIGCDNVPDTFDVLYFGTLALRGEYNRRALDGLLTLHTFKEVFVDVNIRAPFYSADTVRFAVNNATILKVSFEELKTVAELLDIEKCGDYGTFSTTLADNFNNLKLIIITLGADGAYAYDCVVKKAYFSVSDKVKVVSTVGAGDSFSAAFLHKYLRGFDIQDCLAYANKIACKVVSEVDAVPEYRIEDFA